MRKPRSSSTRRGPPRLDEQADIPAERLPVRVPYSLALRIKKRAEILDVTVSELVRSALLRAFPASLDNPEPLEMREDWVPPGRYAIFEIADELKPPVERTARSAETDFVEQTAKGDHK